MLTVPRRAFDECLDFYKSARKVKCVFEAKKAL